MAGLYFALSPENIKNIDNKEIAQIDVGNFELLQFNQTSMMRKLSGNSAKRFSNRVVISELSLNEYSEKDTENLNSRHATYKDKRFHLHGGVKYKKNSDFSFTTQRLFYDKTLDFIYVPKKFTMQNGLNLAKAENMVYDRKNGTMRAEKINALFDTKGI